MAAKITQKISPFLSFDGNAEEAAEFYVSVFPNSRILGKSVYGDHGPLPKGTTMTVWFELCGMYFIALNGGPSFTFSSAMSLLVSCDTQQEIDSYWEKLQAGGGTPIRCGWLRDRFGLSWQVAPAKLPQYFQDPEASNRVMHALIQMVKLDLAAMEAAAAGKN